MNITQSRRERETTIIKRPNLALKMERTSPKDEALKMSLLLSSSFHCLHFLVFLPLPLDMSDEGMLLMNGKEDDGDDEDDERKKMVDEMRRWRGWNGNKSETDDE